MKKRAKTARARWRPPRDKGRPNATERRYEAHVLAPLRAAGEVLHWRYEALKFRLADNTFYTPDWVVFRADGLIELVDVKGSGGWEQHTRVKFKVAAEQHPEFVWVAAVERRGRRGDFDREEI